MSNKQLINQLYNMIESEMFQNLYKSPKYKELNGKREISEGLFINSINQDTFDLYDDVESVQNEINLLKQEECFKQGFELAKELYK